MFKRWKHMTELKQWPYPELKDVKDEELNKFFYKNGRIGIAYNQNRVEKINRNMFYKNFGHVLSWGIIIYGMIMLSIIFGGLYILKHILAFVFNSM